VPRRRFRQAVTRLEQAASAPGGSFHRTSRAAGLNDTGQKIVRAGRRACWPIGEAVENEALAQSVAPRGLVASRVAIDVRGKKSGARSCLSFWNISRGQSTFICATLG